MPLLATLLAIMGALALLGLAVALSFAIVPGCIIYWLFTKDNSLGRDMNITILAGCLFVIVGGSVYLDIRLGIWVFLGLATCTGVWLTCHPYFEFVHTYDDKHREFYAARPWTPAEFNAELDQWLEPQRAILGNWVEVVRKIIIKLYEQERNIAVFPSVPEFELQYRPHQITELTRRMDQAIKDRQRDIIGPAILLEAASQALVEMVNGIPVHQGDGFDIALVDLMPNSKRVIAGALSPFWTQELLDLRIGETLRDTYRRNAMTASHNLLSATQIASGTVIHLADYPGTPNEAIDKYLRNTPFKELLDRQIRYGFSDHLRSQHAVIVASSGAGKTQFLEAMIAQDLAQDDPPGMVVIDSKNEMIQRIAHLDVFHPDHGRLRDRLVIIDPRDAPSLNMFDIDVFNIDDRVVNDAIGSLMYFVGTLLGAEITSKQSVIFIPLVELMVHIPGATLRTFVDILDDLTPYMHIVERLPPETRDFLVKDFRDRHYNETRSEIKRRLHQIILRRTLNRMFSAPRNALNIAQALNEGKIILVSTERNFLADLSPLFGRYIISRVISAALERAALPRQQRRPAYLFVDECAPYVDEKIDELLTTMRSYGLGAMLAFQEVRQMGAYVSAIQGNTAIKLMSSVQDSDARAFAADMRTSADFISQQRVQQGDHPTWSDFACYTRDLPHAVSIRLSIGQLDRYPTMSEADYKKLRALNAARMTARPPEQPIPSAPPNGPDVKSHDPGPPPKIPDDAAKRHDQKDAPANDTDASPDW